MEATVLVHIAFIVARERSVSPAPGFIGVRVETIVYARHGRGIDGVKVPCGRTQVVQPLAEGKGVSARRGPEEAGGKAASRRTETP